MDTACRRSAARTPCGLALLFALLLPAGCADSPPHRTDDLGPDNGDVCPDGGCTADAVADAGDRVRRWSKY